MSSKQSWIVACVLLVGGCLLQTEPECDLCTTSVVVAGVVTTTGGAPVQGARIFAAGHQHACSEPSGAAPTDSTIANASGAYSLRLVRFASPGVYCLTVSVQPPVGSTLAAVYDTFPAMRFRPDWKFGIYPDTAYVNAFLAPVP